MKKITKFKNFIKINKLKESLKQENIAKSLDMIAAIRGDKKPELPPKVLINIESHLLFILNNLTLEKVTITKHFNAIIKLIQDFMVINHGYSENISIH